MHATAAPAQATVEETTIALSALARHLMGEAGRGFMREVERLGLSMPQVKALGLLEEGGALTIKAMSDRLGLSEPAVSRGVETLVRRGLASRADDPDDRRCKRVSLTAKGRRTFESVSDVRTAGFRAFVESLEDAEREALAAGLRPLMQRPEIAALVPEGASR